MSIAHRIVGRWAHACAAPFNYFCRLRHWNWHFDGGGIRADAFIRFLPPLVIPFVLLSLLDPRTFRFCLAVHDWLQCKI